MITRQQALDTGMSDAQLKGLVRRGEWTSVRHGVYTPTHLWERLDDYVGRPRARARAAHLTMRSAHVLSHESAARELGLPILTPEPEIVHVTRRGVRGGRTEHGVKHHLAPYQTDQVVVVEGVPVLDIARTAVDIAREHGYVHGLVACDSARQLGVGLGRLWEAVAPMTSWPEVTVVRAVIQDSDPGAESVHETLGRVMLNELGLGRVQTQFEIRDGDRWARCDLRVGRHLVECDGFAKYVPLHKGGLAAIPVEQVVWEEKQREDWLRSHRLGMSRLVWADYWGPRRDAAKARLRREYAATCAAYGTDISDLGHLMVTTSR